MRRLVMAQRLSASIAPSPTDRYAAPPELPAPAPPTTPCGGHLLAASSAFGWAMWGLLLLLTSSEVNCERLLAS